jgi:hypothetical protein
MHPLSKVLKHNCSSLYDRFALGAKKTVSPVGAFLVKKGLAPTEVTYYKEPELDILLALLGKKEANTV